MQPQEQPVMKIGELEIRYLVDGTVPGRLRHVRADGGARRARPAGA